MQVRRGPQGLRQAMRDYQRLCAAGESGSYNVVSGVPIIRDGLASSPRAAMLMAILAEVPLPVSTLYLTRAVRVPLDSSTIGTSLWMLHAYGLVARTWDNPRGQPGGRWLYELSPLGRLVMHDAGRGGIHHG